MGNPEDNTIPNDNTASYGTSTSPQSGGQPLVSAQPAPQPAPEVPSSTNGAASPITQPTRPSKKTVWTIVAIVATLLLVAGAITWFVLANQKHDDQAGTNNSSTSGTDGNGTNDNNNSSNNDGSDAKPKPDPIPTTPNNNQLTELSLDDATVQKVYGWFALPRGNIFTMSPFAPLSNFYTEDGALSKNGLNDQSIFAIALQATIRSHPARGCQKEHKLFTYTENGIDHYNTYPADLDACFDAGTVRNKIQEIFGKTIDLAQFEGRSVIVNGDGYAYFGDGDELVNVASGAASRQDLLKAPYKAERDQEHIYIYETVGKILWTYHECGRQYCYHFIDGDGNERTDMPINFNPEGIDLAEYKDELDKFKGTFTKTADGNYVYTSLERI